MEELNRRRAVVTVHPTAADCCRNIEYAPGVHPSRLEYGTDTTRAIMGIAFSGDAARYPNIRYIWSHAGGSVPFLAGRIENAAAGATEALPDGFTSELRKFYYDTAGAANRGALVSLLELVATTQIVFGTDFPPGIRAQRSPGLSMRPGCSTTAIFVRSTGTTSSGCCRDSRRRYITRGSFLNLEKWAHVAEIISGIAISE